MHLSAPKPLHGWRAFFGEVGVIVLGVLIALVAQQVAEDSSWRSQVAEARATLDNQLAGSRYASLERIALFDCNEKKLDFLDEVLSGKRPAANLTIRLGSLRVWSTSAWQAATASGAVAHMPPDVRNHYATLFAFTDSISELNHREFAAVTDLRTLERHPQLNDISRDRLVSDVATARALAAILKLGGEQWLEEAKALDLKFSDADRADLRNLQERYKICVLPDGSEAPSGPTAATAKG